MLKKYINLKLNIFKKEIITRREPLTGTVLFLCCLNHLNSDSLTSLRSGLQNLWFRDTLRTNAQITVFLSYGS
jgi:hypothetical protein